MIAIDTNVLLRRLLQDEPYQAERVDTLSTRDGAIFVTDIVLCEALWTLTGKRYRIKGHEVASVVISLLSDPQIVLEDDEAVWAAVDDFSNNKNAGFPDALIVNKAKRIANGRGWTYGGTFTFDKGALEIDGTQSP